MSEGKGKIKEFVAKAGPETFSKKALDIETIKRRIETEFFFLANEIIEDFAGEYREEDLENLEISLNSRIVFSFATIGLGKFLTGYELKQSYLSIRDILELEFNRNKLKLLEEIERNKEKYNSVMLRGITLYIYVEEMKIIGGE